MKLTNQLYIVLRFEVKNEWSYTTTPLYAFMVRTGPVLLYIPSKLNLKLYSCFNKRIWVNAITHSVFCVITLSAVIVVIITSSMHVWQHITNIKCHSCNFMGGRTSFSPTFLNMSKITQKYFFLEKFHQPPKKTLL